MAFFSAYSRPRRALLLITATTSWPAWARMAPSICSAAMVLAPISPQPMAGPEGVDGGLGGGMGYLVGTIYRYRKHSLDRSHRPPSTAKSENQGKHRYDTGATGGQAGHPDCLSTRVGSLMKRCTFRPGSLIRASNSTAASAPICSGLISPVLSGGLEWIVSRMLSNPMRSKSTPARRPASPNAESAPKAARSL